MFTAYRFRCAAGRQKVFRTRSGGLKSTLASTTPRYMLKLDHDRGPALLVGINVEKGLEDKAVARRHGKQANKSVAQLSMTKTWDWHRAVGSLPGVGSAIQRAAAVLETSLYCWVEFGTRDQPKENQYFLVTPDAVYLRGGFKPVTWDSVAEFAAKPRPAQWGRLSIMRAFSLEECTPELDDSSVLSVLQALRGVRDTWRGISNPVRGAPRRAAFATSTELRRVARHAAGRAAASRHSAAEPVWDCAWVASGCVAHHPSPLEGDSFLPSWWASTLGLDTHTVTDSARKPTN